ncbi:MAG: hypothetical protein E6H66_08965 [Betaproteobacteria bacterium]|nr:MAG: hypothetical protein E6H66_08965 [Betaproteobacteria bacterium]
MARRRTYLHPQSRVFWFELPELRPATWKELELALQRKLTRSERERVARIIESARFWRSKSLESASTEDIKTTLGAIAKMSDAAAAAAEAACDVTTRSYLRDGKFIHGAATIQASAAEALAHFPILGRGPRHARAWQAIVVDNVLHLWRALGGAGYSASVNPAIDYATPPVRFGVALFAEVQRIAPSTVAKLLTDAKKREGTNIG